MAGEDCSFLPIDHRISSGLSSHPVFASFDCGVQGIRQSPVSRKEELSFSQSATTFSLHMFDSVPLINHFPYLGIFLLLILGAMGLPFPEDIILLLSGYLVADDVIKAIPTVLVAYLGLLITDFSLFLAGKRYGRKIVEHKRFRKVISQNKLSKLEEKIKKWGVLVIFLGRHILGLRAQIFIASGLLKMPLIKFIFADALSALFTIGIWGGIGYLGGNSIQGLKKNITSIQSLVVVVFFIFVIGGIIFWYVRSFKTSRKK